MNYEQKILQMRKSNNSYVSTILKEAVIWKENLDEIIVLCDILRILDQNNVAVSRGEVRRAFNKYYKPELHSDKIGFLNWIYKEFHIKSKTLVFSSQVRKNNPVPQTCRGKSALNSHENKKTELVPTETPAQLELKQNGGKIE